MKSIPVMLKKLEFDDVVMMYYSLFHCELKTSYYALNEVYYPSMT